MRPRRKVIQNFLGGNNFGWSKHHLYLYHKWLGKVSVDSNFEPAANMVKNQTRTCPRCGTHPKQPTFSIWFYGAPKNRTSNSANLRKNELEHIRVGTYPYSPTSTLYGWDEFQKTRSSNSAKFKGKNPNSIMFGFDPTLGKM